MTMDSRAEAVIIGAAIVDVPAGPVDAAVFETGSSPVAHIRLGYGGDALNEATLLRRLDHTPRLVSVVGDDEAGRLLLAHCRDAGLDTGCIRVRPGLDTGVNIVLVAPDGERHFVTASEGGLRALRPADIPADALDGAKLLCFASIFVLPHFGPAALEDLFRRGREAGLTVCADFTKRKNGESVADIAAALRYTDYLFPNEAEAALLTGERDPDAMADALLATGAGCVVLKRGAGGCLVKNRQVRYAIPAYAAARCVDTTGAGDCFVAAFIAALLEGRPLETCARYACACASLAVEHMGATAGFPDADAVQARWLAYQAQQG